MSGQYEKEDEDRDVLRAEELVATIGTSEATILDNVRDFEKTVAPLKAKLDEDNAPLQKERDDALEELTGIVERMMREKVISGKTIPLRSGVVSVRTTSSLEVKDESLLRTVLRKAGVLTRAFVPQDPKLKLNKTLLGKFLKTGRGRALLPKLSDALETKETTRMTVKPAKVESELRRDLNPLRIDMPSS